MLQELILCKKVAALTEADLKYGPVFDLDSPINFAVMKRKLKYGLQSWNYCKIKIREK
jgi:hypothetical protein